MNIIIKFIVIMLLIVSYVEDGLGIEVERIDEIASYIISPGYGADYENPRFSPDGTKIATKTDNGLLVMNVDGNGKKTITDKRIFEGPVWSPDGSKIAFVSYPGLLMTRPPLKTIYIINKDGTNLYDLTKGVVDHGPVWSPDGTKIAFYRIDMKKDLCEICTVNIDGSNLRKISTEEEDFSQPLFTPDGTKILSVKNYYTHPGNTSIWIMNIDGSGLREITKEGVFFTYERGASIWSPDGKKLWIYGGTLDIITGKWEDTPVESGIVSPDWKWIVYENMKYGFEDTPIDSQLGIMSFYGANNVQITNEPDMVYEAQDWSRDGKMIVVTKEHNPEKFTYPRPRIVVIKLKY